MLRIVTDGGADYPEGWEEEYQIDLLPLRVRFGEEEYTQGINLDVNNFYRLVEEKRMVPNSSLPSPHQVVEFYRKIANRGDEILSIHITSKLSGTFSIIQMAAKEVMGEFMVCPFDSGAGSIIQGFMCREARMMQRQGASMQDILKRLEEVRKRVVIIFTLDTLEYARMNGRINGLMSAISSMLKVKPIIVLGDGLLHMGEKVRTRSRSIERVIELVRQRVGEQEVIMGVVQANDPTTANEMMERVRNTFRIKELVMTDLSIPVAANLGPGTVGIAAYTAF